MTYTATYSPDDNKLRLYASARLDPETYARVKAAGFRWAPKQDLFVAPMWTPDRADLCVELAGQIDDDDTSLIDRAEERADRFTDYHAARTRDAEQASAAVHAIAGRFEMGQPILVGHHSERKARKDQERMDAGLRRAVRAFETAQYWTARAAGALRHAKYKERPDVRARRIKTLEAEARKVTKHRDTAAACLRVWQDKATPDNAALIAGRTEAGRLPCVKHPEFSHYWTAYDVLRPDGERYAACPAWTLADVQARAAEYYPAQIAHWTRWMEHYEGRLAYERAMLAEAGGTVADRTGPEVGGACQCWASPRGGWSLIQKVNKVTVTVLDNWGNGGPDFTRTIPFDKLRAVMSRADVEAARAAGRLIGDARGFILRPEPTEPEPTPEPPAPPTPDREPAPALAATIETARALLAAPREFVTAPTLYPTPADVAAEVVELAEIAPGHRVLEPSAGTGRLIGPMPAGVELVAVELVPKLAEKLRAHFAHRGITVRCADFTEVYHELGTFDRIVMNPPFNDGADIRHIDRALALLRPGGRLVTICAAGPRQRARFAGCPWIDLPPDTFAEAGTHVNTAIVICEKPA